MRIKILWSVINLFLIAIYAFGIAWIFPNLLVWEAVFAGCFAGIIYTFSESANENYFHEHMKGETK